MTSRRAVGVVALMVWLAAAAPQVLAQGATTQPAEKTQFLRWAGDERGGKLEAAVVTYRNRAGVRVDLVSAVHVGDRAYFEALSEMFRGYDAVLYEMVKPAGMAPPRAGEDSGSGVSSLQRFIKDMLGLEFQLDAIDYHARNFVHADLDAETFTRMQAERRESIFMLMLQSMLDELMNPAARQARTSRLQRMTLPELLGILTSPDRARQLKLLLAPEFQDLEGKLGVLSGPDGSVLLTERNKAAIKVLRQAIAKGNRKVAIFYGAAHMPDLEKRLAEMGFAPVSTRWLTAWDVPAAPGSAPATQPAAPPPLPQTPGDEEPAAPARVPDLIRT